MAAYAEDTAGRQFAAIITVEQRTGTIDGIEVYDVTHAVSGRQKRSERVGTRPQGVYPSTNASKIKIADFLKIVNGTHQSILPQDVLDHFGETKNPGGYYTNRAKFSASAEQASEKEQKNLEAVSEMLDDGSGRGAFKDAVFLRNPKLMQKIIDERSKTQTAAFQNWFAGSRATNTAGEPLLMFHGAGAKFTKFDAEGKPIWLTANIKYAEKYSTAARGFDRVLPGTSVYAGNVDRIIPAYIRVENPADVGNTDGKYSEGYIKKTYREMRQLSDEICAEHGLSVIPPSLGKGMDYKEYAEAKRGTSWKQKLKQTIDRCVITAKDYDEFLKLMQDAGYEIKTGKYISFRAEGQERFTRAKTIGDNYTEERIKERIQGRNARRPRTRTGRKNISLISDIQNRIKQIDSKGFEHSMKIKILKEAARTLNYLTENELLQYADLEKKVDDIHSSYERTGADLKVVEAQLRKVQPLIKNISSASQN